MNTYITADCHFGHSNIKKFCPETRGRFSENVETMNEEMITEWNSVVQPEDLTYIVGDFAFMSAAKATEILHRLNGSKILIEGNHDRKCLKDINFRNCFLEVHNYLSIVYKKTKIIMCHYPFYEWDQMHYGSVHFYGHVHGKVSELKQYRARDVGMDSTGKIVVNIEDAIADALTGKIRGHHG